ncbi:hypothetical protein NKR23_g2583 [Pleurostoma richardsiae]|uniref:Uncharacterized protein n=1 Tax=Pleurostoma richardsiae TaxID=41990 RepID=A0AA38RLE8_9PEZI|nr:hypothetical protein NKR23_g2583 [Pleurostoma richardsiae]
MLFSGLMLGRFISSTFQMDKAPTTNTQAIPSGLKSPLKEDPTVRPEADGQYEVDSPDDLDHDTVSHGSARSEEHRSSNYAQNPSSHGLRPHSPIVRSAPGFIGLVEATDTPGVNQTSRDVTTPTDGRIAFSHGVVGRGSVEEAEEVAFFLRQYSEGLAKGMDLWAQDHFFSQQVLILARNNALVRYSVCALAAKHMGQMENPTLRVKRVIGQERIMKTIERSGLDYLWYGAKYYERAVRLLSADISSPANSSSYALPSRTPDVLDNEVSASYSPGGSLTDGLEDPTTGRLVAVCILVEYERLSTTLKGWAGHLNGFAKLLHLDRLGQVYLNQLQSSAMQMLFWHFCFQDWEESFVTRTAVRVDVDNAMLWHTMGLSPSDGDYWHRNSATPNTAFTPHRYHERTYLYELIRLMCRLANNSIRHLDIESSEINGEEPQGPERRWAELKHELDTWHDTLPPAFQPDACLPHGIASTSRVFVEDSWFSTSVCGLSMIYYYTAQILLTIQRPSSLTTSNIGPSHFDLLVAYRAVQEELRGYARKIVSIASGMHEDAMKMYIIQPLYVAGRCLTDAEDRRKLLDMLRGIEREFGIFTEYRVKALCEEWRACQ